MSAVYNPQAELMAEIERQEAEARDIRRRINDCPSPADQVTLTGLLREIEQNIQRLQARLD